MTVTAQAPERAFPVAKRGETRDDMLRSFRISLRKLVNPDTGLAFTEREIAAATSPQTRWVMEADALDLVVSMPAQQRALWLADQVRMDRASSVWLTGYHGKLWGEAPLPPTGGSGAATGACLTGTIFAGSTTLPDEAAVQATDPAGKLYQVLYTETATGPSATLVLAAVDTGDATNLSVGTVLTWGQLKPAGAEPTATVATQFRGGLEAETDGQFAKRLAAIPRNKPASGNNAHFRKWATQISDEVEDAFIYSCALHAGTTVICITAKRGSVKGPTGRIPTSALLGAVTSFLVPPGSPVVPCPPLIVVVPPTGHASSLVARLALPAGQDAGWADLAQWPTSTSGSPCTITQVTTQTAFQITIDATSDALPNSTPAIMAWDATTSRWESLLVQSVTLNAGLIYDVVLSAAPAMTLTTGQYVSPDTKLRGLLSTTIEAYFDSLGPGEVVGSTDSRYHRCARYPGTSEEYPPRVGSSVLTYLGDALGTTLADSVLDAGTTTIFSIPLDPTDGPSLNVAGKVGIYPLSP